MVGNCHMTTGREAYVDELKKYIDVDIYGHCGKEVKCGEFGELHVDCVKEFIGQYKFYLAFENSFCDDYYTEKLTKLIGVDTIPVVMGMANYTEILTQGTFLDVRNYTSPQKLAKHLLFLSKNDVAYSQYIERKRSAKCAESFPNNYLCRVCRYLHKHRDQVQMIPDARKLWGTKERCQDREQFFTGIADTILH